MITLTKFMTLLEGRKRLVYRDEGGRLTIGIGHLLSPEEKETMQINIRGINYSLREALPDQAVDNLFDQDIEKYEMAVLDSVKVELNDWQRYALVSFCFNVGINAFKAGKLLKRVNQHNFRRVPLEFMKWVYVNHEISTGLIRRRTYEVMMWYGEWKDA